MKSFPSSLNKGNHGMIMNHSSKSLLDQIVGSFKDAFKNAFMGAFTAARFGAKPKGDKVDMSGLFFDDSLNNVVKSDLLNKLDLTNRELVSGKQSITIGSSTVETADYEYNMAENPYNFDFAAIDIMNKYNRDSIEALSVSNVASKDGKLFGSKQQAKRSLFNPYNAVHVIGMTQNVPLTFDQEWQNGSTSEVGNISDCRISRLVDLSAQKESILGNARYKYADFAFCKDLGTPNNRLITLRKFARPVGDNIFGAAANSNGAFQNPGDIGRMCCYFDTDDNKLEEILKYSFSASWKEMTADIEQLSSQENDKTNPLGMIVNALNPQMNDKIETGFEKANNNLIGKAANTFFGWDTQQYYDSKIHTNYDQHKIYTPRNTIQSMHKYEGKLEFKHEFTLVFSYKLRGYDNINPKSAMLDLLANVFATTYQRGAFWGGRSEIIGAQPNKAGWNKANNLVSKSLDEVGGLFAAVTNGTFDLGALLGSISNYAKQAYSSAASAFTAISKDPKGSALDTAKALKQINAKYGFSNAAKGLLKNQLGRPEIYAFQSLLDGSDTGLWHVTIGNPLNPIAAFGNLIITDVQVQQLGPLGIDDFPSELKVSVSLKHARPRDAVAIERMYTKGTSSIYAPISNKKSPTGPDNIDISKDKEVGILDYAGDYDETRIKANCDELCG